MVSIPKSGLVMCRSLHFTSGLDLGIAQCRGLTADQHVHPAVSWFHLSVLQACYHHTYSQFKLARFKSPGCRLVSDSFSWGSVFSCLCPLCHALQGHLTSNQMNNLDKQDQLKGPVFAFPHTIQALRENLGRGCQVSLTPLLMLCLICTGT